MILILTTESGDFSHTEIINWLKFHNASYKIITGEEVLKGETSISIANNDILCDGVNLTRSVSCVYYRRWIYPQDMVLTKDSVLNRSLVQNLFHESQEIRNFFSYNLKNAIWIPNPHSIKVNKLAVLESAQSCGLLTPKYIVTTKKRTLKYSFGIVVVAL